VPTLLAGAGTGCLGLASSGASTADASTSAGTDASASQAGTDTPPPCEVGDRPDAEAGPAYPPLPATLSPATAVGFATDFEEAYRRNAVRTRRPGVALLEVETTTTADVLSDGTGYLVALRAAVRYGHIDHTDRSTATETSYRERTVGTASYYASEDRALRVETETADPVDPKAAPEAVVVACG
jgi:hypothetical protein